MNVLSLFDGMSCGQQALLRSGIKVDKYYASEVDKYAIEITMKNYPNTIQLGDVRNVKASDLKDIDIIIGGSPCQSFSFAGLRKGMSTKDEQEITTLDQYLELKEQEFEFEGQSYLFWEFVRLYTELKPKYFFLENVQMIEKWELVISKTLGIRPIKINSALLSAQNRVRLYWTNIGAEPLTLFGDLESTIEQPKDKEIYLRDILEDEVDEKYFLSDKMVNWLDNHAIKRDVDVKVKSGEDKSSCLTSSALVKGNLSTDYICHNLQKRSPDRPSLLKNPNAGGSGHLSRNDGKTYCLDTGNTMGIEIKSQQQNLLDRIGIDISDIDEPKAIDVYNKRVKEDGKVPTLTDPCHGSIRLVVQLNPSKESNGQQPFQQNRVYDSNGITPALMAGRSDLNISHQNKIRKLTPIECERLQTVPDNYTEGVSDTQRYKMLGNGWTVDVISHIFNYLPKEYKQ